MSKKRKIVRSVKRSNKVKNEDNEIVYNRMMYNAGQHDCPVCPPWRGDNRIKPYKTHGTKKPKYKDKHHDKG